MDGVAAETVWTRICTLINAQCMRIRYTVIIMFVCVCVYHSSTSVQHACNNFNLPVGSPLNSKGFQLTGFTKKLSFPSYVCFFCLFLHGQVDHLRSCHMASSSDDLYLQVSATYPGGAQGAQAPPSEKKYLGLNSWTNRKRDSYSHCICNLVVTVTSTLG